MKRLPSLVRDEHPTLETFERVLNRGVMVDRGPEDRRRGFWDTESVAGGDLLDVDFVQPTYRAFGDGPARRRHDDD